MIVGALLLSIAAALVLTLAASGWRRLFYETAAGSWIGVGDGSLDVGHAEPSRWGGQGPGVHIEDGGMQYEWWVTTETVFFPDVWIVTIPLWMFAVLAGVPGAVLFTLGCRARRRAKAGACAKCGYDLRASASGAPCPECGAAVIAKKTGTDAARAG